MSARWRAATRQTGALPTPEMENNVSINLLLLVLITAVCGSIGQALAGYSIGGCLISIVVGLFGAFIGTWLGGVLGLPEPFTVSVGGETFPVLWSVIGSALFVAALALITRRRALF